MEIYEAQRQLRNLRSWIISTIKRKYVDINSDKNFQLEINVGDNKNDQFRTEGYFKGMKIVALGDSQEKAEINFRQTIEELGL